MTKTYILENLCCANCAAKIERKLQKVKGVNDANIAFMTLKLTMDIADGMEEVVYAEAEKIIHKIEPDVVIKERR